MVDGVMKQMEEKQRHAEELKHQIDLIEQQRSMQQVQVDADKQASIQKQNEELMREYQRMQEETLKLQKEKVEIEERAKRDREESNRLLKKQEEEKRQNDRFKLQINEVEKKIKEANECAKYIKKNVQFSLQLVSVLPEKFKLDSSSSESIQARQEIRVKVQNSDNGRIYEWSVKKFNEKLDEIKDKMDSLKDQAPGEDNEDPFDEEQEPILMGQAYYVLKSLAYLIDSPNTISIVGSNSGIMGKLDVNIVPVDEDGESEISDEMIPDSPDELEGRRIDFIVQISKAFDLKEDFCKDVFCEYSFFLDEQKFSTQISLGKNMKPDFNYRQLHTMEACSSYFIQHLMKDSVRRDPKC